MGTKCSEVLFCFRLLHFLILVRAFFVCDCTAGYHQTQFNNGQSLCLAIFLCFWVVSTRIASLWTLGRKEPGKHGPFGDRASLINIHASFMWKQTPILSEIHGQSWAESWDDCSAGDDCRQTTRAVFHSPCLTLFSRLFCLVFLPFCHLSACISYQVKTALGGCTDGQSVDCPHAKVSISESVLFVYTH